MDPKSGHRIDSDRYSVIPRTLTFLINRDQVLLLRLGSDRGAWAGKFNGVGGHVEQAEDPLSAALREVQEETGIAPSTLTLCGLVHIDVGDIPGISLYIYVGETHTPEVLTQTSEGTADWQDISTLENLPLVEDLLLLLPKALESYGTKKPFSASYNFDDDGKINIHFSE